MAGPTVEELLRAGGQRRAPPKPEEVGAGETFVNRAVGMIPGANRLTDAIAAMALEAGSSVGTRATLTPEARAELQSMGEEVLEDPGLVDRYRDVRDTRAARTEEGSKQNPWAGRAGALTGFGLSLFAPLPKASGNGLGAAVKTGAGYGALQGLTEGGADLTRGEFVEGAADTLKGAAFGGALGAGFHGAMRLGQRAKQGLTNARQDVLAQETMAAREAAEEGQAAAAKVAERERKMVGQAREMNKAKDARAMRSQERAQRVLERARRRDAPPEDPSTKVLEGMSGKAFERQQNRSDKALGYRRSMGDPDVDTQLASARQDFIDRAPEALSNPASLRRQYMERFLREKYGDEVADRLMRERIGPGGEVLPRAQAPAPVPAAAADDVSVSAQRQLGPGQEQLPLLPPLETAPAARQLPSPLAPMPTPREGATGMPYGQNLRRELPPPEPTTQLATQSMAAPRDAPMPQAPLRTAPMPSIQPTPAMRAPTADVPTANGRPALPAGAPAAPPSPAPPMANDIQDVTRLAGPEDVAPLAAERAMAREQGAVRAVGRAGYEGVRSGQNVLGAVLGGIGGVSREMLRDPAVKARVLSAARLQVLSRINPALAARVGAQLQEAGPRQRAAEHLLARRDPEYREARQKAAEQVSAMSDQQLVELFATAAQGR